MKLVLWALALLVLFFGMMELKRRSDRKNAAERYTDSLHADVVKAKQAQDEANKLIHQQENEIQNAADAR